MTDARRDVLEDGPSGIAVLDLPTDVPRRARSGGPVARYACAVPDRLARDVRRLAAERGGSPAAVLLAAYQVLLGVYCRQADVAVGARLGGSGGVRTMVVRTDLAGDPSYGDLVDQVLEQVRRALDVPGGPAGAGPDAEPLLRAWFAHDASLDDVRHHLALGTRMTGDRCEAVVSFDPGLFTLAAIERLAGHWLTLLAEAVSAPSRPSGELLLTTEAERRQLLEWGVAPVAYPTDRSVADLFAEQVAQRPDAVAVEFGAERLTYADLDARAGELAGRLADRGVRPGVLVPVCVERGPDLVVSLLAVHRTGAASVPLDPEYPAQRLAYLLADAAGAVVVSQARLRNRIPATDAALLLVDALPGDGEAPAGAEPGRAVPSRVRDLSAPAYVIYTSGSTGRPKGVVLHHAGLVNVLFAVRDMFAIGPGDGVLFSSSVTFDVAQTEVFVPLISGGRVVIASRDDVRSPATLAAMIVRHDVTLVQATPSAWRQLAPALAGRSARDRQLMAAGEVLPADLARDLLRLGRRVTNGYGPTETTVYASIGDVRNPDAGVTIGRPTANAELYVVDPAGRLVPVGVPGELLIGGVGVAIGYHDRPELTAERFVAHPFSADPAARVYRSGDLVRWRPDGELDFLGRIDHQVKVRGFRVEPGEIDAVLSAHEDVAACAVVAREDVPGTKALVAYCVPVTGRTLKVGALRTWCGRSLPEYMVPTGFVLLPALPTTSSGKIDRTALPTPEVDREGLETQFVEPRTPAERAIARTWAQALWVDDVGAHDDFFDLGGDSLIATRVALALGGEFGVEVPVAAMFTYTTVEALAEVLTARRAAPGPTTPASAGTAAGLLPDGRP